MLKSKCWPNQTLPGNEVAQGSAHAWLLPTGIAGSRAAGSRAGVGSAAPSPLQRGEKPFLAAGTCSIVVCLEAPSVCECWGLVNLARMLPWGEDHAAGGALPRPSQLGCHHPPWATSSGMGCSLQPSVDLPAGGMLRQWESRCHAACCHCCCGSSLPASSHSPPASPCSSPASSRSPSPGTASPCSPSLSQGILPWSIPRLHRPALDDTLLGCFLSFDGTACKLLWQS